MAHDVFYLDDPSLKGIIGSSTGTKSLDYPIGSRFFETDTKFEYLLSSTGWSKWRDFST